MLGQVTWSGRGSATGLNIVVYNPDLWGYGLGYEAFGLWCDYLFEEAPTLDNLHLETWSGNAGMVRLAQKRGFVEQSRDRRSTVVGGRRFDSLGYVLNRIEWGSLFPEGFAVSLEGEQ
jgi:putative hydrolase of HD superfamily